MFISDDSLHMKYFPPSGILILQLCSLILESDRDGTILFFFPQRFLLIRYLVLFQMKKENENFWNILLMGTELLHCFGKDNW